MNTNRSTCQICLSSSHSTRILQCEYCLQHFHWYCTYNGLKNEEGNGKVRERERERERRSHRPVPKQWPPPHFLCESCMMTLSSLPSALNDEDISGIVGKWRTYFGIEEEEKKEEDKRKKRERINTNENIPPPPLPPNPVLPSKFLHVLPVSTLNALTPLTITNRIKGTLQIALQYAQIQEKQLNQQHSTEKSTSNKHSSSLSSTFSASSPSPSVPERTRAKYRDTIKLTKEQQKRLKEGITNKNKYPHSSPSSPSSSSSAPFLQSLPSLPVFYPTPSEWSSPMLYISLISPLASPYGGCKIIPPSPWSPPFNLENSADFRFKTRNQAIHQLGEGVGFEVGEREYTLEQFKIQSEKVKKEIINKYFTSLSSSSSTPSPTPSQLEEFYWRIVSSGSPPLWVEYGNDIDTSHTGSGFEAVDIVPAGERGEGEREGRKKRRGGEGKKGESKTRMSGSNNHNISNKDERYAGGIGWNLRVFPLVDGSLLSYLPQHIPGVSTPWLYFGQLFSSFCWHNEDDYLYSINYLHSGEGKIWYLVSGEEGQAEKLEEAIKGLCPQLFVNEPDLLDKLVVQMDPLLLSSKGIKVSSTVQNKGEYIITFPKAYHCGFSLGYNCGEAVNFATAHWLQYGREARETYGKYGRSCVFSHTSMIIKYAEATEKKYEIEKNKRKEREEKGGKREEGEEILENKLLTLWEEEMNCLLIELNILYETEALLRSTISPSISPTSVREIPLSSAPYQCEVCKDFTYLSYVQCGTCRGRIVCIKHKQWSCREEEEGKREEDEEEEEKEGGQRLYGCRGDESILLFIRYSLKQIHQIIKNIEYILVNTKRWNIENEQKGEVTGVKQELMEEAEEKERKRMKL